MGKIILLLLTVFFRAAIANKRTCFCEIRTSTDISDPVFMDPVDPVYSHWLHLTCGTAKENCPDDCRVAAASALGGSVNPISHYAGTTACERLRREVTPDDPVHLYAHYSTSSCDHSGYQYLGEVCCWEIDFGPGYPITYMHNPSCSADEHPLTG
ncbi:Hypp687 [Branchiostoma lanceolatum]|uniref:Hypp687 protein n=1 Tax=Branchiostoma lanceolatum TaxID=7740 RepID=A0A8J9WE50_BRALA|nr:Hypp687 [Branchiostoma lanceolatum]